MAGRARTNGHGSLRVDSIESTSPPEDVSDPDVPGLGVEEALAELESKGVILRDPARGLVDFPSRHQSGIPVHLCWQSGEEDIEWWHLPDDGFAGRRRLPLPPEL